MSCVFCDRVLQSNMVLAHRELVVAFADAYPSSPGHLLVIPVRHVERLVELTTEEQTALFALAGELHATLAGSCDAVTIGINDGPAAGQTVPHVHLHLIPRHTGDVADPRGGIRNVLADTARYWDE